MERTVVNVFRAQCNPVWHFLSLIVFVKKVFTDTFRTPTPEAWSNSCPLSQRYHPTISSSFVPSSSCLQSFPASPSFPMSQFFTSGGQTIGVSASPSVLPMNIQNWFPLWWTIFYAAKDGETLHSQQKQNQELTVAQIRNSILPNSDSNWRN